MGLLALIQELGELHELLLGLVKVFEILGLCESFFGHAFTWEMLTFKLPHTRASLGTFFINFDSTSEGKLFDLTFLMAFHLNLSHLLTLVFIAVMSHEEGI